MADVMSAACIEVILDARNCTVQDVRDWLAEVDRLNIPNDTALDECILALFYRSQILEPTHAESNLGVEGIDILVGMPR